MSEKNKKLKRIKVLTVAIRSGIREILLHGHFSEYLGHAYKYVFRKNFMMSFRIHKMEISNHFVHNATERYICKKTDLSEDSGRRNIGATVLNSRLAKVLSPLITSVTVC